MEFYNHLSTLLPVFNLLLAGIIVFLERRNIGVTWAWLMVLLLLPVVGFVLYLIFGQNWGRRKLYKIEGENRLKLEALTESQRRVFKQNQIQYRDPMMHSFQDMMYMNLMSGYAFYTQNNEVEIFTDGNHKFESLLRDIHEAKVHIHLQYYIVRDDGLGQRLVDALARKAKEGVQVRFLYDDIGCSHLPRHFFRRLTEAGGHVASFFPSRIPYLNIRVNYRNHRKLAIIDGVYGYIGGFNVGDEYLGLVSRFGEWRDTHLRIQGSAVLQMQGHFLLDWNLASGAKLYEDSRYLSEKASSGNVGIQIVASGPDNDMEQIKNAYIKMFYEANERIIIQSPYFIPDESVLTALKMAVLSGVDVRIMIPSKPDHKMVYWASYSYLGDLLAVGMKCFLYEKGFLHAKAVVVDGMVGSVGTANMDIRSFKLNFEINAILYDSTTASKLESVFQEDLKYCRELTYEEYKSRPRWHQMRESCIRLLSPIL